MGADMGTRCMRVSFVRHRSGRNWGGLLSSLSGPDRPCDFPSACAGCFILASLRGCFTHSGYGSKDRADISGRPLQPRRLSLRRGVVNWIVIATLIGAAQGCFIAYLVLVYARRNQANVWLGFYVLAYAALCLGDALSHSTLALRYPDLAALFDFCIFLLGPFLYQYVRALTLGKPPGKIFWVHLIPALLMLFFLGLFHLLPMELKRSTIAAEQAGRRPVDPVTLIAAAQIVAYLIAALRLLRKYSEKLKQTYSSLEKISFSWLKNLLLVNCALWLVWVVAWVTQSEVLTAVDYAGFPIAAYILATFALRAPEVLVVPHRNARATLELSEEQRNQESAGNQQPEASVNEAKAEFQNAQKLKYQKSRLPEEVLNRYQRKLESVMS
jgi:hypothetical protein